MAEAGTATVLGHFGSLDVCEKESAEPRNIRISAKYVSIVRAGLSTVLSNAAAFALTRGSVSSWSRAGGKT